MKRSLLTLVAGVLALVASPVPALAQATHTATLLLEAFSPAGTAMSLSDFVEQTAYVASPKWKMYWNYGIFPMGKPPATAQLGTGPTSVNQGAGQSISFTIPSGQPIYFTSLWKADVIGTVFMRADNAGKGYTVPDNKSQVLQLPYEFALSEYSLASQIAAGAPSAISNASARNLQRAASLVQAATSAPTKAARARASYQALAVVMPLKEQLTIEISNSAISQTGFRPDFDLNYEGFGSWTDQRFVANYQQAHAAGFRFLLTLCDWNVISPSRGVYNFSSLDYQIERAIALGYGVSLSINQPVGRMPSWVAELSFDELKTLYRQNALTVVQRYRGKLASIYPQAEPELAVEGHTLQQIAELTRQSLEGARAADANTPFGIYLSASAYVGYQMNPVPNANYISGWELLSYLSQNNIHADFLGLEMQYATVFAPIDLQRQHELLQTYFDVAQVPIYIGETGYSSKSEDYGVPASFYWHDGLTQQAQSEWADGLLRIAYGSSFIKGLYWVHLDPDDYDYNSDFLTSLIGCSLFRPDGASKKSYATFLSFTSQISAFVPGASGAPVSLEATGGDGQSVALHTPFPSALQATVRDFLGNAVPGATVTFRAPASGARGVFPGLGSTATAVTNSDGVATAPIFAATGVTGQFQVEATVAGVSSGAFFTLTNTPRPLISAIDPAVVAVGRGPLTLTVRGTGFVGGSRVFAGSTPLVTTFVSSSELTAIVPGSSFVTPARLMISVVNPGEPASDPVPLSVGARRRRAVSH